MTSEFRRVYSHQRTTQDNAKDFPTLRPAGTTVIELVAMVLHTSICFDQRRRPRTASLNSAGSSRQTARTSARSCMADVTDGERGGQGRAAQLVCFKMSLAS